MMQYCMLIINELSIVINVFMKLNGSAERFQFQVSIWRADRGYGDCQQRKSTSQHLDTS